ncbi:uncharacterized protein LOC135829716 isoform X2 [Sycon ciliatum]|uniref:uncharacterized protein LOC135829716 isoform X2 n=1 Tax=Sycon ciliatum TaxID=27933 RepID=UPI0031F66B8C
MSARPGKSLYVRNLSHNARNDDLRKVFEKYGPISDVYMPLDYYTHQPRGFAYVQFDDPRDADEALYGTQRGARLLGRELEVEFAKGDRKDPHQMRSKEGRFRSPDRRDRRRRRSYSRSPSPRRRSRSPRRRSPSPDRRPRSRSRSPYERRRRSYSPQPRYSESPPRGRRSRSPSPR